ncbi:MAG: hypothetical protein PHT12_02235 [Patescibacteria group bacterium]|nr:hypothetical protein [Patescibacteria group bacterium]
MIRRILDKFNVILALTLALTMTLGLGGAIDVLAATSSTFTQTINPGSLAVTIVDAGYAVVPSPTMAMGAVTFSFACQTATGSFGTATEQIYVANPDASDTGWAVSLAASATTAVWTSAGTAFDFNDPTGSGCTDGADAGDAVGGQMTVNPAAGTLAVGPCSQCVVTNVSKGSSAAFSEGVTNAITILTGAALSNDIGNWTLQGATISQTIPLEQPAASDYSISMVLTIAAI